jgi:hypothetical protein
MAMSTPSSRIPAALVWLDRSHALVARPSQAGANVTAIPRDDGAEAAYLARVTREAGDCDALVVTGSDAGRLAFEREYVALFRRPDRIVDAGPEAEPDPVELADRLRFTLAALERTPAMTGRA